MHSITSFYHYRMSLYISDNLFNVHFILYNYSWFLLTDICLVYHFHPFTFNIPIMLYLKWVSCRQHTIGPWFCCVVLMCFFFFKLGLLIGIFRPFTFNFFFLMFWLFSCSFYQFSHILFLFSDFLCITWTYFRIPFGFVFNVFEFT